MTESMDLPDGFERALYWAHVLGPLVFPVWYCGMLVLGDVGVVEQVGAALVMLQ